MGHPYYFHAPGHPSRWCVVDVGLKCMHSCKFCYYSFLDGSDDQFKGMRHADFYSLDHLKTLVSSLNDNGFLGFDVTGGEPTLHPNIVEMVRHATDLGLSSRIITLGQYLMRKMKSCAHDKLIDGLLEAGLTNFLFSVHATEEFLFKQITGESWGKLSAAMDYLDALDFHYTTNTTVVEDNYRHLPMLAKHLSRRGTYLHNFIVMNAYYEWGRPGRAENVQAHYGLVAPYVKEATAILEEAGIGVNIRYAPLCTMAGYEKNVVGITGVRYDPYEWMNCIEHHPREDGEPADPAAMGKRIPMRGGEPSPGSALLKIQGHTNNVPLFAGRGSPQGIAKVFPETCKGCHAIEVCDGIDARYVGERGPHEFIAYMGDNRGQTLDVDRLKYAAPFFVKRKPDADMKSVVRKSLKPLPIRANPRVSVIVTCFNYGQYLSECLSSVMAQTWPNLEVILVDDGSTDNTGDIAREFGAGKDSGLTYIWQPNSGQPAYPRNVGIEKSTGELVMCLDADDMISPSYVEECVTQFQCHPEASIVYPGTRWFGEQEGAFRAGPYSVSALVENCIIVCASMYKREVWDAVGGYKTNVRGAEDHNFWIEAAGLGFFGTPLPRQLFFYRRHPDGIFETDVVPNIAKKFRQIVLNNSDLYPPGIVKQAKEGRDIKWIVD